MPFLEVTSIRRGFAGGGFEGRRSLPKRMALAAGVRGAELIPDTAELFLGFTSTQRAGLGPPRIANLETLGFADMSRSDYFRGGTHMALSHIFENLEAWYLDFDHAERVATTFRPGLRVREGVQTVRQAPKDVADGASVARDFRREGAIGHSSALQTTSRLQEDVVGADGVRYPKGTAIPHRADFNTLDNPFAWSADAVDGTAARAAAPASTSSSSTRRATTSTGRGSPWTASCRTGRGCRSGRAPEARGSTRCCARRTGRTSSCRRAGTARFRSSSCSDARRPSPSRRRSTHAPGLKQRRARGRHLAEEHLVHELLADLVVAPRQHCRAHRLDRPGRPRVREGHVRDVGVERRPQTARCLVKAFALDLCDDGLREGADAGDADRKRSEAGKRGAGVGASVLGAGHRDVQEVGRQAPEVGDGLERLLNGGDRGVQALVQRDDPDGQRRSGIVREAVEERRERLAPAAEVLPRLLMGAEPDGLLLRAHRAEYPLAAAGPVPCRR